MSSTQLAADNATRFSAAWGDIARLQRAMVLHLRLEHKMSYKAIERRTGLNYRTVAAIVREADDE